MAFVKARIEIKPASVGTGIKATLRRSKTSAATLLLYINTTRAAALNIGDGDGIEVMIGDAEHHGLLRLRKNNSAGVTKAEKRATGKADFFVVKLGHQAAFVDRSESPAWCQWEMVDDGFVQIVLPKWAAETAPGRTIQRVAPNRMPAAAATTSGVKQSVTAGLMGDPPPGRRQMLEQVGKIAAGKK